MRIVFASFEAWLGAVNQACCAKAASQCTSGLPSSCDMECADILTPFLKVSSGWHECIFRKLGNALLSPYESPIKGELVVPTAQK